jgi:hypothetical protein
MFFNTDKCKYISNEERILKLDGKLIDRTEKFKYFGMIFGIHGLRLQEQLLKNQTNAKTTTINYKA